MYWEQKFDLPHIHPQTGKPTRDRPVFIFPLWLLPVRNSPGEKIAGAVARGGTKWTGTNIDF